MMNSRIKFWILQIFTASIACVLSSTAIAGVCGVNDPVNTGDIIFQTDFSEDTGYYQGPATIWNTDTSSGNVISPPAGWTALRVNPDGYVSVEPLGVNGTNALKLQYRAGNVRGSISLGKHLTGDVNAGYEDLYIRYHMKFPNKFKASGSLPFWKWGRLWQNTSTQLGGNWTENRVDSGYVVWGMLNASPRTHFYGAWGETTGDNLELGSNGGPYQFIKWDGTRNPSHPNAPGHFESAFNGAWGLDSNGDFVNQNQDYHTIEFHFKLASSAAAEDGEFEIWFDGVRQLKWNSIKAAYSAPERTGISTNKIGSGFNFFSLFDNMQGWNRSWADTGVDGYLLINDVVVSTSRIGHDHVVSGVTDSVGGN